MQPVWCAKTRQVRKATIDAARRAGVFGRASVERVIVDSTLMPKAIAHPTDSRLMEKSREHLVKFDARNGLSLRQNYNRVAPRLAAQAGRYAHAKQYRRMRGALRTLRTRVGRVRCDVERQLDTLPAAAQDKARDLLHRTGMRSMPGNPYDGRTVAETIEEVSILCDTKPTTVIVDCGYRGVQLDGIRILMSGQRRGITKTMKAMIKRRSAIEPTIGHMKLDAASPEIRSKAPSAMHCTRSSAAPDITCDSSWRSCGFFVLNSTCRCMT